MLKANMWCPDCTCGAKLKEQDFQIEVKSESDKLLKTTTCPNSKKKIKLKHMGFAMTTVGKIDASKKYEGRSPKEREERRTNHFVKDILPTLGGSDKKHFQRKFGIDKKGKRTK